MSSSLSSLFNKLGRVSEGGEATKVMDILEFVESPYGLNMTKEAQGVSLHPVQRFIIKAYYNIPLDDTERFRVPKKWYHAQSAKPEHYYNFTEQEYMRYLFNEGRCNIPELDHDRRRLILPIGRRSGKSFMSGIVGSYETYRLLRKSNPQSYYGLIPGTEITLSTVAPTKDQSKILYNAIRNNFQSCKFFEPYLSHDTQSYMRFQTPYDIEETGDAQSEGGRASYQIRFFSSSSSGLRGHANLVVILDEVAFFKNTGGSSAQKVYDAVTPSLGTFSPADPQGHVEGGIGRHSEGRLIMISSPYAKSGLFYDQYEKSKTGNKASSDFLMVQAPTWEVNPDVPVGFLENAHADDPTVFATEFGAEFTDRVSAWIDREKDLMVCLDFDLRAATRGRAKQAHQLGMDLAVVNDRTSLVLTRPEADKIRLVYHEEWQAGVSWYDLNPHLDEPFMPYAKSLETVDVLDFDELAEWVKQLSRRFYIEKGLFDQWHAISFGQTLTKMGLTQIEGKQFTKDETSMMFDAFKTLMHHNKLLLYDYVLRDVNNAYSVEDTKDSVLTGADSVKHAPYITELLELRAEKKSKKVVKVEAPPSPGKHDDFSDALIRSVWLSLHNLGNRNGHIASARRDPNAESQGSLPASQIQYNRQRRRRNNYVNNRGDRLAQIQRLSRRRRY